MAAAFPDHPTVLAAGHPYTRDMTLPDGRSIGHLARETGETVKTLRYWTDLGLLDHTRRGSGYRVYGPGSAERVRFIRTAQQLSFSLHDIAGVLAARAAGEPPCATVRRDLGAHLATVREQIARLQTLEAQLVTRLTYAEAHPDPACDSAGCVYLEDHAQA